MACHTPLRGFDALSDVQELLKSIREQTGAVGLSSIDEVFQSLHALSVAQYNLKQLPQAVESMRSATTLNQKSVNANLWLGMLLRQTEKLDEAETYMKQADQLAASNRLDAHWQLALLFKSLNLQGTNFQVQSQLDRLRKNTLG